MRYQVIILNLTFILLLTGIAGAEEYRVETPDKEAGTFPNPLFR